MSNKYRDTDDANADESTDENTGGDTATFDEESESPLREQPAASRATLRSITDAEIMEAFSAEVTRPRHRTRTGLALDGMQLDWTGVFYGWCLAKGIPLDRATDIHGELSREHGYDFKGGGGEPP